MISGVIHWKWRRPMWLIGIVWLMFIWFIPSRRRGNGCLSIPSSRMKLSRRCASSFPARKQRRKLTRWWRMSTTQQSRRHLSISRFRLIWTSPVLSLLVSLLSFSSSSFSSPNISFLNSKWKHGRLVINCSMITPKVLPKSKPNTELQREQNKHWNGYEGSPKPTKDKSLQPCITEPNIISSKRKACEMPWTSMDIFYRVCRMLKAK